MPGNRKNVAKLKRLWLTGRFTTLGELQAHVAGTANAISLGQLKAISAKHNFFRDLAAVRPQIEARGTATMIKDQGARLGRIQSQVVDLVELLVAQAVKPLKDKKTKFTLDDTLKASRTIAELMTRVIAPRLASLDRPNDAAPTGESPAAAALAQANVTINMGAPAQAPADDGNEKDLTDEELVEAIRAGQAIVYDERPAKPASAKRIDGPAKKGAKAKGGKGSS